jgi:hypothetical protein
VQNDKGLITHEKAEEVGVSYIFCQTILTENMGMKHVTTKSVPQLLTQEYKENHLSVVTDLPECAETNENFSTVINHETKQ